MPIAQCKICLKSFYVKPSHLKLGWGKYCSKNCQSKGQLKGKFVKCFICDKKIYRSPKTLLKSKSKKYFCSKTCQTLWRNKIYIGDRNKNWKNGESSYRNILKREGIKARCNLCGTKDERVLTVHHKDRNRNNNKISNLIWLCLNCHYLVHRYSVKEFNQ